MIRALYTAASGMNAQQTNIDNVAHNLANVNTTGFKKSRVEFEDLVYQQIKAPGTPTAEGETPIGLEAGLGARAVATARNFSAGNLRSTSAPLDLAIEGQGFFQITLPGGETGYTRAGAFHLNGQGQLGQLRHPVHHVHVRLLDRPAHQPDLRGLRRGAR